MFDFPYFPFFLRDTYSRERLQKYFLLSSWELGIIQERKDWELLRRDSSNIYSLFHRILSNYTFPTLGSEHLSDFLFKEIEGLTKGMWVYEPDPLEMARILIERIDAGRKALGIDKKKE